MKSRSDEIAQIVIRAITDKRLPPGCKLGEQSLADVFAVSRAVVRQALIKLSDEGLVTMERNRGAFVFKPSYRDAVEIYDALTFLEQGVAAQLSGRLSAGGWAELRDHVERQRQAIDGNQEKLADELGSGFHELLVRFSRNSVVQQIHAQLVRRAALLRFLVSSRFDYCGLLHDHGELVDLLEAGRVSEAQELIAHHHYNVVRGFILDDEIELKIDAREALLPYVTREQPA